MDRKAYPAFKEEPGSGELPPQPDRAGRGGPLPVQRPRRDWERDAAVMEMRGFYGPLDGPYPGSNLPLSWQPWAPRMPSGMPAVPPPFPGYHPRMGPPRSSMGRDGFWGPGRSPFSRGMPPGDAFHLRGPDSARGGAPPSGDSAAAKFPAEEDRTRRPPAGDSKPPGPPELEAKNSDPVKDMKPSQEPPSEPTVVAPKEAPIPDGPPGVEKTVGQQRPRAGASQARLWQYMHPYTAQGGGRNVECCILVPAEDGEDKDGTPRMRKCGATFKHTMGGSTTNLLRHLRKKHPEEARKCLEGSKNSTLYKTMQAELKKALNQKPSEDLQQDAPATGSEKGKATGDGSPLKSQKDSWNSAVDSMVKTGEQAEAHFSVCVRKLAMFCAVDLHPYACVLEDGFQRFLLGSADGSLAPKHSELENHIFEERRLVSNKIRKLLRSQQAFFSEGRYCALQLDSWQPPQSSKVYAVATATLLDSNYQVHRVGLDVHAFPGDYTVESVTGWLRSLTDELFDSVPNKVFSACTVGSGRHLVQAANSFQIPVLKCSAQRLNNAVMSAMRPAGLKEAQTGLMRRAKEIAKYVMADRKTKSLNDLQETIGKTAAGQQDADSPTAVLSLFQAFLTHRKPLTELLNSQGPTADLQCRLEESDWVQISEAIGILEVCAEVERSLRADTLPTIAGTVVLMRELREYLEDSVLHAPDLNSSSADDPWLEKTVEELDPATQRLRRTIAHNLSSDNIGSLVSKEERLACVLDASNCTMLFQDPVEASQAWQELSAITPEATGTGSHGLTAGGGDAEQSCVEHADESGKRKWQGALSMRMQKRKKQVKEKGKDECHGEVATYKQLVNVLSTTNEEVNTLQWWARRSGSGSASADSAVDGEPSRGGAAHLPSLARQAARYLSIDASSMQASQLLSPVGYRIAGLESAMHPRSIENMLFLRLNQSMIESDSAARGTGC